MQATVRRGRVKSLLLQTHGLLSAVAGPVAQRGPGASSV